MDALNAPTAEQRLSALKERMERHRSGVLESPVPTEYVNNHIHTIYSFSPYSPAMAAYRAWESGLQTAGIMDHDSVAGAEEFLTAGELIGIAATVGFECRCSMAGTPYGEKRLNHPDQRGAAYVAVHGVPRQSIPAAQAWLAPFRERRNERNRAMVAAINTLLTPALALDFDRDVAAISQAADGGAVTERHILFALARRLMERIGRGPVLLDFLGKLLPEALPGSVRARLLNPENSMYDYDLLGALKSGLVESFYIDADDELPSVVELVRFADEIGAISAYAYLGDVRDSVTGDKKDQTFEDEYLDQLVPWLAGAGFRALTYMPSRNTAAQLSRVMALCHRHGLLQISGEDINSPSQSFLCPALAQPAYRHLVESTWALIGHQRQVENGLEYGLFSPQTIAATPGLHDRIRRFAALCREK